jgi:hypothetical protein
MVFQRANRKDMKCDIELVGKYNLLTPNGDVMFTQLQSKGMETFSQKYLGTF